LSGLVGHLLHGDVLTVASVQYRCRSSDEIQASVDRTLGRAAERATHDSALPVSVGVFTPRMLPDLLQWSVAYHGQR
jgi:hypothetical protein